MAEANHSSSRRTSRVVLWIVLVAITTCLLALSFVPEKEERRRLQQQQQQQQEWSGKNLFGLTPLAAEWCAAPLLPPLDYTQCSHKDVINSVPLYGGLTNSLKMVLLGTILSLEQDRCFFVDESASELTNRGNRAQALDSFLNRYFEPIGLPRQDPRVQKALHSNNNNKQVQVQVQDWTKVWQDTRNRRMYGQTYNLPGYPQIEGHLLKRVMLRRMWRPLPHVRQESCMGLASHGLNDGQDFMTLSVRRGDKSSEENFRFATIQHYIDLAEQAIPTHFDGRLPKVFVATDDCTVLPEFRTARPDWTFLSECDADRVQGHNGFALADMTRWSQSDTDAHYRKFFIELYAMAVSKYFIGVWYTNVSWFAQFMRGPDRTSFIMLDTPGTAAFALDWN